MELWTDLSNTSNFPCRYRAQAPSPGLGLGRPPRTGHYVEHMRTASDGDFRHEYRGAFLYDNYHGRGEYYTLRPPALHDSQLFVGHFYCNDIEGYGSWARLDGTHFDGLFCANERYGPGVLTHPNDTQDVGLWQGERLVRLSVVVQPNFVPKLASSPQGKSLLLQHRRLISLKDPIDVPVQDKHCDGQCDCKEDLIDTQPEEEYVNIFISNRNSKLFDKKTYDEAFYGPDHASCNIEVLLSGEELDQAVVEEEFLLFEEHHIAVSALMLELVNTVVEACGEVTEEEAVSASIMQDIMDRVEERMEFTVEQRRLVDIHEAHQQRFGEGIHEQKFTKKVPINHLIAWNNNDLAIDMLKHTFMHRHSEPSVTMNVSKVLVSDRSAFLPAGPHEQRCCNFLAYATRGSIDEMTDLVLECNVDVRVVDARGNSALFFAMAADQLEIIQQLVTLGVDVDWVNDESLTALQLCILRYLAVKYKVVSWEKSFLIEEYIADDKFTVSEDFKFCPNTSLLHVLSQINVELQDLKKTQQRKNLDAKISEDLSLNDLNVVQSMTDVMRKLEIACHNDENLNSSDTVDPNHVDQYLFAVKYFMPPKPTKQNKRKSEKNQRKGKTAKSSTKSSDSTKSKKLGKSKDSLQAHREKKKNTSTKPNITKASLENNEEECRRQKIDNIFATISILLHYGASLEACDIPLPPLMLAVFSYDIRLVKTLLQYGADPNSTTEPFNLSALHILAVTPNVEAEKLAIFDMLTLNGCKVMQRTHADHFPEQRKFVIGKYQGDMKDIGKTALDLLALRSDFEEKYDPKGMIVAMTSMLLARKVKTNMRYLGHSPLTLAILRKNVILVAYLAQFYDVNEDMQCEMGVPLCMFILKRYSAYFDTASAIKIIDLLVELGANPLKNIDNKGNIVEFITKEYAVPKGKKRVKDKKRNSKKDSKKGKGKSSKRSNSIRSSKKSRKLESSYLQDITKYFKKIIKNILSRKLHLHALKYLFTIRAKQQPFNDFADTLARLIPDPKVCVDLLQQMVHLNYIQPCNCFFDIAADVLQYVQKFRTRPIDFAEALQSIRFEPLPRNQIIRLWKRPEFSADPELFHACFQCGQRENRQLQTCPDCGLVQYCSVKCNKADVKRKNTTHKCAKLYYNVKNNARSVKTEAAGDSASGVYTVFDAECKKLDEIMPRVNVCCSKSVPHNQLTSVFRPNTEASSKYWSPVGERVDIEPCSTARGVECHLKMGDTRQAMYPLLIRDCSGRVVQRIDNPDTLVSDSNMGTSIDLPLRLQSVVLEKIIAENLSNKDTSAAAGNLLAVSSITDVSMVTRAKHDKQLMSKIMQSDRKIVSSKYQSLGTNYTNRLQIAGSRSTWTKEVSSRGSGWRLKLPPKYRHFLETFRRLFPDVDISALVLPYACFSNGQFYYRFLDKNALFISSYSEV